MGRPTRETLGRFATRQNGGLSERSERMNSVRASAAREDPPTKSADPYSSWNQRQNKTLLNRQQVGSWMPAKMKEINEEEQIGKHEKNKKEEKSNGKIKIRIKVKAKKIRERSE